jgi:hypothetical protein
VSRDEAKTGRLPPASDANGPDVARITLRRAAALQIREALASGKKLFAALAALDAALAEPDAKREPATVEQVIAASAPWWSSSPSVDFFSGFRAAERHYGITKEDKT